MRTVRSGFGLIDTLIAIAVAAGLVALSVPVVTAVSASARRARCQANLRQIGVAVLAYAGDQEDRLPAARQRQDETATATAAWFRRLPPYVDRRDVGRDGSVFQCPCYQYRPTGDFCAASPKSLKMNEKAALHLLGTWEDESGICLFLDGKAGETGVGQWGHCTPSAVDPGRHRGSVNLLAVDGSSLDSVVIGDDHPAEEAIRWMPRTD